MARRSLPSISERPFHTPEQKRHDIERLSRRIGELEAFDPQTVNKRHSDPNVAALEAAIKETLASIFGNRTPEYNRYQRAANLDNGPVAMSSSWLDARGGGYRDEVGKARQYLEEGKQGAISLLKQAVRGLEEEIEFEMPQTASPQISKPLSESLRKIFIVHGHDEAARESVARFIQQLGFEPIILHEQPNKGRTIITKFREEAAGVGFAVVLITPDDQGGKQSADTRPRARQNVVFELGFFIGALGPERVAALMKGEVEKPSDFDGVVYISMDQGDWKIGLAKELNAAGFNVDFNKVFR